MTQSVREREEQETLSVAKAICIAQGYNWPPAYDRYSVKVEKEAVLKWWIEAAEHAIEAVRNFDNSELPMLRRQLELTERQRDNASRGLELAMRPSPALSRAVEALKAVELQIEYLHEKFQETGSGNQVLVQIREAYEQITKG